MRFKGLDLNLLVTLDVLIEERSVSRAAERLHLSQPSVSAALARLRITSTIRCWNPRENG
jgi:LysR family nod box-dependent transcriptional activator